LLLGLAAAAQDAAKDTSSKDTGKDESKDTSPIIPKDSTTQGTVTVGGHTINYQAVAGTILVGATKEADASIGINPPPKEIAEAPPTARMFYVAYFKKDAPPESRPVTFVYNGGPGSSTVW
jgi:carboxypeptidase C (cathepsin A)